MKTKIQSVLSDFVLGGALVAGALLLANLVSPLLGGVLAGAPIRTSAVVFLHYLQGRDLETAAVLSQGVLIAMVSNVFFALTLYLALPRFGFAWGFGAAIFVFICCAMIFERLSGLFS